MREETAGQWKVSSETCRNLQTQHSDCRERRSYANHQCGVGNQTLRKTSRVPYCLEARNLAVL